MGPTPQAAIGRKQSVRDRLGSGSDKYPLNSKRQRGDNNKTAANGLRLGKNDHRFKLLKKNVNKQVQNASQPNGVDLRQTLSRTVLDYKSDLSVQQRIPEPMDSRPAVPHRRKKTNSMHVHPVRSANLLPRVEPLRNPRFPWSLEQLRERALEMVSTISGTVSPLRNDEEAIRRPLLRPYDDARAVSYITRDVSEPRTLGTAPNMRKPTIGLAPVKSVVPPISRPPLPSVTERKSSCRVDERLSVDSFLCTLGLDKYVISFEAEEVDMATLRQMGEHDLKELGIPMGPRKKILLALLPRPKVPLR